MKLDLLVFDLDGTLLDMRALDPHFVRAFGDAALREAWFEHVRALWMAANATRKHVPFDRLAKRSLEQLATDARRNVSARDKAALLDGLTKLPPFPDVEDGLKQLRKHGRPIVALTNNTLRTARAQLRYAGISHLFDAIFSADEVGRYKPAAEAYLHVLRKLDVAPGQAKLVAAHDWDIAGARAVGMHTTVLRRPGSTRRSMSC